MRALDGLNVSLSNFLVANPNNNSGDIIQMEQPNASFNFTKDKVTLFGSYTYGDSHWNTPVSESLSYLDIQDANGSGKNRYKYLGHVASVGLNWSIATAHTLSAKFDFRHENTSNCRRITSESGVLNRNVFIKSKTPVWGGTLFYNGTFGDKAEAYSELTLDYLDNNNNNYLDADGTPTDFNTKFKESRRSLKYVADLKFHLSDKLYVNPGYQVNWRKYESGGFSYVNTGNKWWGYLNYTPNGVLELNGGLALNYEYMDGKKYFDVLPSLEVQLKASKAATFRLSYVSNSETPTLAMLNPQFTALNPEVYQRGNAGLKNAISHRVELSAKLFGVLTIEPQYTYTHN